MKLKPLWHFLAILPAPIAMAAGFWWISQNYCTWEKFSTPEWKNYANMWGGNPDEIYSHWLNMMAFSGLNVSLIYFAVVRNILGLKRLDRVTNETGWTLITVFFALACWGLASRLDYLHGEGETLGSIMLYFAPMTVALQVMLRLAIYRSQKRKTSILTGSLICILLVLAQALFEPSDSGAPNSLVIPVGALLIAISLVCCTVGAHDVRWLLRDSGYDWITWKNALLFWWELGPDAGLVLPHRDIEMVPGYEEGNIRHLIRLTRLRTLHRIP